MKKRIVASAFLLFLLTCILTVTASASDFTIEKGVLKKYTGSGGDVAIPDSVTSIGGYAFSDCVALISVTVPNSVTSIRDYAFSGCTGLTSVTIPNSVTSIGWSVFEGCSSLTSITIPNSVTSIGKEAFKNCNSLTDIVLPDSVTSIGSCVFQGCTSLTRIDVAKSNQKYSSLSGVLFNKEQTELIAFPGAYSGTYTIPNSVKSIHSYAFSKCSYLTGVTIPNSVRYIDKWAFVYCTSLASVTIPDSVIRIGYINAQRFEENVFYGCTSLTKIDVVESNQQYSSLSGVLFNKKQTVLIAYPCGLSGSYTIPDGVTLIEERAFYNAEQLTKITIPNSITYIALRAFVNCSNLKSVIIPDSVTSIRPAVFYGCTGLTSVTLPDSITSICENAFFDCIVSANKS